MLAMQFSKSPATRQAELLAVLLAQNWALGSRDPRKESDRSLLAQLAPSLLVPDRPDSLTTKQRVRRSFVS